MTTTKDFLRETLNGVASKRFSIDQAIERIIDAYPRIDDHAGERGYWNTSDEYGNISGPYDSYEDAMDNAPVGASPYWVEEDDEEIDEEE